MITTAMLAEYTAAEIATLAAQAIVRTGGRAADTRGNAIYASRVDVRMPVDVFDPELKRVVHVFAKIRITIEREV
jgi:hypothetical protein